MTLRPWLSAYDLGLHLRFLTYAGRTPRPFCFWAKTCNLPAGLFFRSRMYGEVGTVNNALLFRM